MTDGPQQLDRETRGLGASSSIQSGVCFATFSTLVAAFGGSGGGGGGGGSSFAVGENDHGGSGNGAATQVVSLVLPEAQAKQRQWRC